MGMADYNIDNSGTLEDLENQVKKILAKLGTIAAHRKALLAIFSSKTKSAQ